MVPSVACVVRESETQPTTVDLLGVRDVCHKQRFTKLVPQFVLWRDQRLPGARAIHSTYDRAASTVMKWLFLGLHDVQAISTYEYLLPFIVSSCESCLGLLLSSPPAGTPSHQRAERQYRAF